MREVITQFITQLLRSYGEVITHLSCSPNFPSASYLDERTADV